MACAKSITVMLGVVLLVAGVKSQQENMTVTCKGHEIKIEPWLIEISDKCTKELELKENATANERACSIACALKKVDMLKKNGDVKKAKDQEALNIIPDELKKEAISEINKCVKSYGKITGPKEPKDCSGYMSLINCVIGAFHIFCEIPLY